MSERFGKFTERAKKALALAQQEAVQRFNHNYIGTEHLLLGLAAEGQGIGARMLASVGLDLPRLREELAAVIGRGGQLVVGDVSLTPRAKRAVELAVEESRGLGQNYVGTEHLLLGLINTRDELVGQGVSVGVLQRCGIDIDALRADTLKVLAGEQERLLGVSPTGTIVPLPAAGPRSRDNVVTCRVDDATLGALDGLVEAGVHTTRSEAAARLIVAGIRANRPLFEKVQAAVREIRRVREETQALVRMWDAGEPSTEQGMKDADSDAAEDEVSAPGDPIAERVTEAKLRKGREAKQAKLAALKGAKIAKRRGRGPDEPDAGVPARPKPRG